MIRIQGEITDPLDKAAIDAQLVGLDLGDNDVEEQNGYLGSADYMALDISFNVDAEANTFWTWLSAHGNTGGGSIRKHICGSSPCVVSAEVIF